MDGLAITRLFWHAIRPRDVAGDSAIPYSDSVEELPTLPEDMETEYLEQLLTLESEMRVRFTPDLDDPSDLGAREQHYRALIPYLHVAAASVIRRQRVEGFYEKVSETLDDVWRELLRLKHTGYLALDLYGPLPGNLGEEDSLYGVMSLIASLVCRDRYTQGNYDESFQCGVESVLYCQAALNAAGYASEREYFYDAYGDDVEMAEKEIRIREIVGSLLSVDDLNPQQIVRSFEGIREHGGSTPWQSVATQCSLLGLIDVDDLSLSDVSDTDSAIELWDIYWHRAAGWAEAQLSPSELRKFLDDQKEKASQNALQVYFLGGIWDNLPPKAQDYLVYSERSWFDTGRDDYGTVLVNLQIAVAAMCFNWLWEPLRHAQGSVELLKFIDRKDDLESKNRSPSLSDYVWLCSQSFFRSFVATKPLTKEDQDFLLSNEPWSLGSALNYLQRGRNLAAHDPEKRLTREEVRPFVELFLGIGQPGVLRRLAEVGPKLAGR